MMVLSRCAHKLWVAAALALLALGCGRPADVGEIPARVEFNRHIRPILSNNCYQCHGPDGAARQAELRLDVRAVAVADRDSGQPAIVPGRPDQSELVRRISHTDPERRMPPAESERELSDVDVALLTRWIEQGAEYQEHWAYLPLTRPTPPVMDQGDADVPWDRNPIDRFVLAGLIEAGLAPSRQADRRILARRLSFDLTGLPPEPDLVEAFVADARDDAYDRLVERLLDSPHYGERLALDWLDQVRFADTNGYHSDEYRSLWPYRDYVIDAFNDNMPFDRFTVEQLAGDLLPNATIDQRVASGFNRLNQVTAEGGAQPAEYLAKYASDRVSALGSVWMGATLACAECHDHKFDPYTQHEFYSLGAFFADVKETAVANVAEDWAPMLRLPTAEQAAAATRLEAQVRELDRRLQTPTPALDRAQRQWEAGVVARRDAVEHGWMPSRPESFVSAGGDTLELLADLSVLSTGDVPEQEVLTVRVPTALADVTGLRIEALGHPTFKRGVVRYRPLFYVNDIAVGVSHDGDARVTPVRVASAETTHDRPGQTVANAIDGDPATVWAGGTAGATRVSTALRFAEPVRGGAGTVITVRIDQLGEGLYLKRSLGRLRFSLTRGRPAIDGPVGAPELVLRIGTDAGGGDPDPAVSRFFRAVEAPSLAPLRGERAHAVAQLTALRDEMNSSLVTEGAEPRSMRVLPRGNWMDDTGDIVEPAVPAFLPPLDTGGRRPTRLDLAEWLVSPDNPLTARVLMNRLWKLFFGAGLSRVMEDLGSQGEWPTHPELLDWLAGEFIDSGWDVKHMVRTMVTSSAYRQTSLVSDELQAVDPDNRLLARQARFRLQAEVVRDTALAISGLLVRDIGGESVKPYQPAGYWQHLNFPKRTYKPDTGPAQYRRGLYVHWQRSFLHPSLMAFDAPSREVSVVDRPVSNTPQQALTLLNDPTYVEAARAFAERTLTDGGPTIESRLDWSFRQALARPPNDDERTLLVELLTRSLADADTVKAEAFLGVGQRPVNRALALDEVVAWASLTRVILNLGETVTRE